jgi:hypothetical protein
VSAIDGLQRWRTRQTAAEDEDDDGGAILLCDAIEEDNIILSREPLENPRDFDSGGYTARILVATRLCGSRLPPPRPRQMFYVSRANLDRVSSVSWQPEKGGWGAHTPRQDSPPQYRSSRSWRPWQRRQQRSRAAEEGQRSCAFFVSSVKIFPTGFWHDPRRARNWSNLPMNFDLVPGFRFETVTTPIGPGKSIGCVQNVVTGCMTLNLVV